MACWSLWWKKYLIKLRMEKDNVSKRQNKKHPKANIWIPTFSCKIPRCVLNSDRMWILSTFIFFYFIVNVILLFLVLFCTVFSFSLFFTFLLFFFYFRFLSVVFCFWRSLRFLFSATLECSSKHQNMFIKQISSWRYFLFTLKWIEFNNV